jgi:hypothetical protein
MYKYAILDENNVCHTVYETDTERDDFDCCIISISEYDTKYINALWRDDLNDWEFPPEPNYIWINNEWKPKDWENIQFMEKLNLYEKIKNYVETQFPNEEEKLNEILAQFNEGIIPITEKDISKETLEEIISYFNIE